MSLSPSSGSTRIIGIGKEVTFGVAVAPTYFMRVSSSSGENKMTPLTDESYQGDYAATHQAVPGTIDSDYSYTGPLALDTVGFPLSGVLGHVGSAAGTGGAPNTHYIALATTQPSSYTISDFTGVKTEVYAGNLFSEFTLTGANGKLAEVQAKLTGLPKAYGSALAPSWTTELPVQTWNTVFSIGANSGSAVLAYAEQWSINAKRELKPQHGATGTQTASAILGTTVEVTGSVTAIANGTSTTELDAFTAGTSRYISLVCTSPSNSAETLTVELLNAVHESGKPVPGRQDAVKYDLTFKSVAAPTTFGTGGTVGLSSPAQITLLNQVATTAY